MPDLPRLEPHAPIYLDNNSTTPIDPAVLEAMTPSLTTLYGNPSNPSHRYGAEAADAIERARAQIAQLIGARPDEIIFTGSATESNNLAILGVARGNRARGDHVVTAATEHRSVLGPCGQLEREGFHVSYVPVDRQGRVDPTDLGRALTDRTVLVSVMAANNEVGTLQPIADLAQICTDRGILFHTDAVQALGKLPIDVTGWEVDLLSVSAHKIYGPKGAGALFVRRRSPRICLEPLLFGGGQEMGFRSGTVAVHNVVGLGAACVLADQRLASEPAKLLILRDKLKARFESAFPTIQFHGHPTETLPNLLNLSFPGIDGDELIYALGDVAIGRGSSCSSGSVDPSHVLTAMGIGREMALGSIRLGIGRFTTSDEIDKAAESILEAVTRLGGT